MAPNQQPSARYTADTDPGTSQIQGGDSRKLSFIYHRLYQTFGPQGWWPADTTLEIIIGAVLTQNTAWRNVEKAIDNLKKTGLLNLGCLSEIDAQKLAQLIRPAGYFNIKARRLSGVMKWLKNAGGLKNLRRITTMRLRKQLIACNGIGPETADSILLYAFNRPVFVVDTYTRRILSRYGLITGREPYENLRVWLEKNIVAMLGKKKPIVVKVFNEFHALFVQLAKTHCRTKPFCSGCPLESD
ncbi:MAG: endonuclease III domain-containing protein [bacterium]